ncbi:hypothetical protein HY213_05775 [Candidatus Peregrinibacteria bacterium]|nr:hypothetical protein [Candidatus Peregrinibacteria bacterium]
MQKTCTKCRTEFDVTEDDLAFYDHVSPIFAGKKYSIPPPTLCPLCRLQRRLAFRNHTALFQRPALPDGAMIVSMHPKSAPFPVMRNEDWFSDRWDPLLYGQKFTEREPFIHQYSRLDATVPKFAAVNDIRTQNCDYCNNVSDVKNCYLTFSTSNAEDCMYGESVWGSKDCLECTITLQSERCYDCTDCLRCYSLQSSFSCEHCSESAYLAFCRSCKNCFGCANLRNREFCIFNEQKTREEYDDFLSTFQSSSWSQRKRYHEMFEQFLRNHPRPHATFHHMEECTGNFIAESRNVRESFFIQYGENLKHCFNLYDTANDCRDHSFFGRHAELIYESCACGINISRLSFCFWCRNGSSDLLYCSYCDACRNCFGCNGLRRKEYCILNTQYTKEEYEVLVPRIIEHMRRTGEWGEFFPESLSPAPRNRSLAQRYFPLTKDEVLRHGLTWFEEDPREFPGSIDAISLPDGLPESNAPLVVRSGLSGQPFRITSQEIERYREFHVPLPRLTYEESMDERAKKLGGIRLYERTCAKTGKNILTTYPPDAPWIVWDRDVYEREFSS